VGLIFPLAGKEIRAHEKRTHALAPGHILLNNPGSDEEKFEVTSDDRRRRLFVGIPRTLLRNHFAYIDDERFSGSHILPTDENAQLLAITAGALSRIVNHTGRHPRFTINAMLGSFMAYLACALHELPIANDAASRLRLFHKQHIKHFVINHLSQPLNIEVIADGVKLSESYIFNLFADESMTLMKWVWEQRLERCLHDLLSNSTANRSIREIAFSWGFNDPTHFSHLFHQRFGMSPSDYRKEHNAAPDEKALAARK
jgi:AraC-like DNA-binding protein